MAPNATFAAAEKFAARDIRNDATTPNTNASNAARTMSTSQTAILSNPTPQRSGPVLPIKVVRISA
jgi:hypothetical protein